ncbi:MAG: DNA polymerase III subunit alpha, partial [Deltaproteobacteria bacterium]|nr:DNA polymerase III subunit alpha [Deltaproteobacteria bacterium]
MASPPYVELGVQSAFSFLEGSSAPEDLVRRAAELGHGTLALCDLHGVYGQPRFHRTARAEGLRALAGARVELLGTPAERPRKSDPPPAGGRLALLVRDPRGYRNLCRLLTRGHAPYGKPHCRVTPELLREHADGLIAFTREPALAAPLGEIFGADLYAEIRRNGDPDTERLNRRLLATGLPPLATGGVRHARPGGKPLLDALTCLRHGTTLDDAGRLLLPNAECHLRPPAEMARLFRDMPDALSNTLHIAARCEFTLENLGYRFPEFPLGPGETQAGVLRELSLRGVRQRYERVTPRVTRQLEHELGVIRRLELEGYFLIVQDIARECRARGILAQGRGSAANSLVCYALGITAIDPVKYELLFERFLSEERGEWPDIDIDLPSGDRREEILQYVYERYGAAGAGMTANVISYRPRSAVREMGKVLGFSLGQVERFSKLLSRFEFVDSHDELEKRLAGSGLHPRAPRVRHLLRLVSEIQHLPRHLSQHSGGMVIAQGRLDEVVPLEPARMPGRTVIQWDKDDCADLGIIKIDLLGLGMMAVLEEVIPLVARHDHADVDLARIPPDDPATYAMLQRADTVGVFQIESRAQMATLPRMKPDCFYDLVVEVAIIRPGPITGDMVQPYLKRRAGREPVTYPHPDLEPILRRTLGVPVFQEQLLRIAMEIAGFSGGEAEEVRRAMGFK